MCGEGCLTGATIFQRGLQQSHGDQDPKTRELISKLTLLPRPLWFLPGKNRSPSKAHLVWVMVVGRGGGGGGRPQVLMGFRHHLQLPIFFMLVRGYNLDQASENFERISFLDFQSLTLLSKDFEQKFEFTWS